MMNPKTEVKKIGGNLAKFGSVVGGVMVGSFVMSKVPRVGPAILQKILPALVGLIAAGFIARKWSNEHVKAAAMGIGVAAVIDLANQLTANQTGLLATLNAKLPKLQGLRGMGFGSSVQNTGAYSPAYFVDSNKAWGMRGLKGGNPNSLQGNMAEGLQGGMAESLQGGFMQW